MARHRARGRRSGRSRRRRGRLSGFLGRLVGVVTGLAVLFIVVGIVLVRPWESASDVVATPGDGSALAACEDVLGSLNCTNRIVHNATPPPPLPEQGEGFVFEGLGTELVRVTSPGTFSNPATRRLHQYSRRQAWNADETLIDLGGGILHADTFEVAYENLPLSASRNWSHTEPSTLYGIRFNPKPTEFGRLDLATQQFDALADFDEFDRCTLGDGEGSLSNDDRWVVLVCHRQNGSRTLISFDTVEAQELGRTQARSNFNWASFTQSGRFVVVENNQLDSPMAKQIVRYNPDMRGLKILTNERAHGDLGIDQSGNDVLVMMTWKRLWYLDIESGNTVDLSLVDRFRPVGHGHVSCRNIHRPGWCYISSYDGPVGAVKLGSSPDFWQRLKLWATFSFAAKPGVAVYEPWGFHYSTADEYASEPKASVSPSGRQLILSSDWGNSGQINDFIIRPANDPVE